MGTKDEPKNANWSGCGRDVDLQSFYRRVDKIGRCFGALANRSTVHGVLYSGFVTRKMEIANLIGDSRRIWEPSKLCNSRRGTLPLRIEDRSVVHRFFINLLVVFLFFWRGLSSFFSHVVRFIYMC